MERRFKRGSPDTGLHANLITRFVSRFFPIAVENHLSGSIDGSMSHINRPSRFCPCVIHCMLLLSRITTIERASVVPSSRTMSSFIRALSQLKVKEVPDFLQKTVTVRNIAEYAKTSFSEYRVKYILPGSPTPIYHVMGGVFVTAYITVWPSEYRHMIAAKKGAH